MMTRRKFLQQTGVAAGSVLLMSCQSVSNLSAEQDAPSSGSQNSWRMPDESEPHSRTWMAFGANVDIWGEELLPVVQQNLAEIALAIASFEPVTMLVRQEELALATELMGNAVEFVVAPLDDFWMRDSGAVFVQNDRGEMACIDFHFNGWGQKQEHAQDAEVAAFMAEQTGFAILSTDLILEGGGIEVDGHGTAIITESCVLNDNRNPGVTKEACEAELKQLLGLQKIIWLPGIKDKDITDGHTDFYARFAQPGVVVAGYDPDPASFDHAVTKEHIEILKAATDAEGRPLRVVVLEAPSTVRPDYESDDFAAGYINFYVCNGAVIMPEFGDAAADQAAHDALQELFPDREIVQLNIDGVAAGGGGIHCTTQQEPSPRTAAYLPLITA